MYSQINRIFHNFKEFYNDINAATLTGAIDIIVVEHQDGTFQCSPFHVRFGKLGVLRSKEKVVDIEINGNPLDIHMKLGESGEAFFVEEVQDSDTEDIPEHLATSPIPVSHFEELYHSQSRRRNSFDGSDPKNTLQLENQVNDYTKRRYTGDHDNEMRGREFLQRQINLGNIDLGETSTEDLSRSMHSTKHSSEDVSKNDVSESIFHMDSVEMDNSQSEAANLKTEPGTPPKSEPAVTEAPSETKSGKKKRRKKSVMKKKNSQRKTSNPVDIPTVAITGTGEVSVTESVEVATAKTGDTTAEGSMESSPSDPDLKETEKKVEQQEKVMSTSMTTTGRKITLDPDFHFFSDTELTAGQEDSRPNTPVHIESVQSDTEFEVQKSKDEGKETHRQSWAWGELPISGPNKEKENEGTDQRDSMLSSMFSFMKQGKHRRQNSNVDGVYLQDISSGNVEPEVAALYFSNTKKKNNTDADLDCESGNGPSLAQSPNSAEGSKSIDSDFYEQNKASPTYFHDISLSMCGWEPEPSEDSFIRNVVAFSDLCNNPAILESPNLVVRIKNKYYNWKVAVPMISSLMIYQRPLPQSTVDQLISVHMPQTLIQKEPIKQEKSSWWGWGRKRASRETTPAPETPQQEQLHIISPDQDVPPEIKEEPKEDEPRVEPIINEKKSLSTEEDSSKAETISNEKCRKTLRLTSDQIRKLNLKDGMNEIEFSVTTAYQGTTRCKCHLYKWRWDDKIVISDIDGTITKSDVLGHILPIVGKDWAQSGVAQLFNKIRDNGYKLLYLSARAIGQARITREYLKSIRQGDLSMPDGPLLLNPTSLITAFHREVIEKKPEQFKISCMSDIRALFPSESNPFYAGYGNRINDVWAYTAVGIPIMRIFTINPKGELKHELTQTFQSSYSNQSLVVNDVFPPLLQKIAPTSSAADSSDECADDETDSETDDEQYNTIQSAI